MPVENIFEIDLETIEWDSSPEDRQLVEDFLIRYGVSKMLGEMGRIYTRHESDVNVDEFRAAFIELLRSILGALVKLGLYEDEVVIGYEPAETLPFYVGTERYPEVLRGTTLQDAFDAWGERERIRSLFSHAHSILFKASSEDTTINADNAARVMEAVLAYYAQVPDVNDTLRSLLEDFETKWRVCR